MTRFEEDSGEKKFDDLEDELKKVKKGLKRKQNKRILSCANCFLFFLIVVLAAAGFVSYVLAKGGLVMIPYLTERVYQEPKPAYIVQAAPAVQNFDFLNILKNSLASGVTDINSLLNKSLTLQISDAQLSQIIRDQLEQNSSLKNRVDYLQVAVLPQNLELFIKLKNPKNVILVFKIEPSVSNSKINLNISDFYVGDLKMPAFISRMFIAPAGEGIINTIIGPFAFFGQVQQIKLNQGKVEVGVLITNLKGLF